MCMEEDDTLRSLRVGSKEQHAGCDDGRRHDCEYELRLPPRLHHRLPPAVSRDCLDVVRQPREQAQQ
jgi:hypothetical protein